MSRTILLALSSPLSALLLAACGPAEPKAAPAPTTPAPAAPEKTATPAPAAEAATPGAALATMREFIAKQALDKSAPNWKTSVPRPPQLDFEPGSSYFWLLNTTEGPIKIRLLHETAPMHVSSTIYLTELGFYDQTAFHRVIPGFMAQGGDPLGTGMGGPAYKYAGEFAPGVGHSRPGILSMANAGPGTDGSQFFLTFKETSHLDGNHTVFGEVVQGLENLLKLEKYGSSSGKTTKPLMIESAKILTE